MNRSRAALWLGLGVAFAAITLSLLEAPLWLRSWFGLPVVVFVPGYALVRALDPRGRVGGAERFALGIGASIAISLLAGLLLSASPAGLQTVTWSAGLGGFSVMISMLALHRTKDTACAGAGLATITREWVSVAGESGAVIVLTGVLALALASVAASSPLGSEQAVEAGRASVLQLWAVADPEGGPGAVNVGVENPTSSPVDCVLTVRQGQVVTEEQPLLLGPDDHARLSVRAAQNASIMFPVEVVLSNADGEELRRVFVWPQLSAYWTSQAVGSEG